MKLTDKQEAWLQALESGAYKQASRKLRVGNSFCCLGVACDVIVPDNWNLDEYPRCCGETTLLPACVGTVLKMDQYGTIRICNIEFLKELRQEGYTGKIKLSLIDYNDAGATFKQLATAIRKYPEAVFYNKE